MADQERDLDAAERALGLSEAEVPAAALARWEARLGGLAAAVPPVAPSAGLLDGVLARVRGQAPAPAGSLTVRAKAGDWRSLLPGITIKLLHEDLQAGRRVVLMRVAPGARYAAHGHTGDEECLVLEGEVRFGDLVLRAGDFHLARPGHRHPTATSATGCLLYISSAL